MPSPPSAIETFLWIAIQRDKVTKEGLGGQKYYNVLNVESAEIDFLYGPNLVRYMTDSEYSKNKYFIVKVPKNSFYVLGDNWYNSDDSRRFGCVNKEDILFKVIN